MVEVEIGREKIEAELATSLLEKTKGMGFRKEGKMLFVFSSDTRARIDMMFLSVPLQLIFQDSEKKVIDVQRAEPWSLDPRTWRLYYPGKPYRYLLESTEFLDVEKDDHLKFEI